MSSEVVDIGQKLKTASLLLDEFNSALAGLSIDAATVPAEDLATWTAMVPLVSHETRYLVEQWYKEWDTVVIAKGLELGNITSYAGSVFNPQDIPVAQMTLCVISDMEMVRVAITNITIKF